MGGLNSGRRPEIWDTRPQVEDAVILDIPILRAHGALSPGTSGMMQWDGGGSAYFQSSGESVTFSYAVKGQSYRQQVELTTVPLCWNNGTSRPALWCSECGRRGYKLYLSRKPHFLCRRCQNLCYEAQTIHYGGWAWLFLGAIKEERREYAAWKKAQARKRR